LATGRAVISRAQDGWDWQQTLLKQGYYTEYLLKSSGREHLSNKNADGLE
jgi:hypothetical protein